MVSNTEASPARKQTWAARAVFNMGGMSSAVMPKDQRPAAVISSALRVRASVCRLYTVDTRRMRAICT